MGSYLCLGVKRSAGKHPLTILKMRLFLAAEALTSESEIKAISETLPQVHSELTATQTSQ